MLIVNSKGVHHREYTLLKNKRVYYALDPKRLPHQGAKERERRVKQRVKKYEKRAHYPLSRIIAERRNAHL